MKKLITVASLLIIASGCYNDKYNKLYPQAATAVACDTSAVSFARDITPIINTYCAQTSGCHSAADHAASGYDFSTYVGFHSVATQDLLISDINGNPVSRNHAMPLNMAKMPDCEINKMIAWLNQGAGNN
jgi:uncharacterized membrane protein